MGAVNKEIKPISNSGKLFVTMIVSFFKKEKHCGDQ